MLIEFSVTNFRSIKHKQVLSLQPAKIESRKNIVRSTNDYLDTGVLSVAVLYGPNNVGKSAFVKAFKALEWLVMESHKFTRGNELLANESHRFEKSYLEKPTTFEIDFIAKDKKRYFYLVEFNKEMIIREELFLYNISPTGKMTKPKLFIRKAEQVSFGESYKGDKKINPRSNMLFLSKAIHEEDAFLESVFDFFKTGFEVTNMNENYIDFQIKYFGKIAMENDNQKELDLINRALNDVDTGILSLDISSDGKALTQISINNKSIAEMSEEEQQKHEKILKILTTEVHTKHRFFDGVRQIGETSLSLEDESDGTRKFIAVYAALMKIIQNGTLLIIDELERSLHPLLSEALISLMNNPLANPYGAQLIFTSHDTYLQNKLDHDQICFLEKDKYGATELYRASDIRGLRSDTPIQKWYMEGKLDAIPAINKSSLHENLISVYGKN